MNNTTASISGRTRVFAVIGDPVAHSFSPLLHNFWFGELGMDAVYVALRLSTPNAKPDLENLARFGISGVNITLPHKSAALEAAAQATDLARTIGAANTLRREDDSSWTAHNTDAAGFARAFELAAGFSPAGRTVLVVGAGGAARAAVDRLHAGGAAVILVNRTVERARELAASLAPGAACGGLEQLPEFARQADAIVNTASLGHSHATLPPLPPGANRMFFDMSYGSAARMSLSSASDAGWRTQDGLTMLVAQAAEAFAFWTGHAPDIEPALARARVRLDAAT